MDDRRTNRRLIAVNGVELEYIEDGTGIPIVLTFEQQPRKFRRMWLENFGAKRSPGTGPALACSALANVTSPTLALGSEHGMRYSRRILERVAACIPHCELKILPGVTHFASYQAAALFNAAVLEFVTAQ